MTLTEDIAEIVTKARERHAESTAQRAAFERAWYEVRATVVQPVLVQAAGAFVAKGIGASAQPNNGSVSLSVGNHWLKFSPKKDSEVVVCHDSLPQSQDEPFSLDSLTTAAVEASVKAFAIRLMAALLPA